MGKRYRALRAKRKAAAADLQTWLTERKERSQKAAEAARKERNSRPRGVDRVPEHLRNLGDHTYTPIASYEGDTRIQRRAWGVASRVRPERLPRETIFHKVDHEGNLTNEKVEVQPTKMPVRKVEVSRSGNVPYTNPARDEKPGARLKKRG